MLNQLKREILSIYGINHPNIVKLFFHFEDNEYIYLGLEPIEGITIRQKLFIEKSFTQSTAAVYFFIVLEAIEYLHSLSPPVIYKHIQPENIVIDSNERLKLIDFFLVDASDEITSKFSVNNSIDYIAPEMLTRNEYSPSIDI